METRSDYVRARIAPDIKQKAEKILDKLGMNHADLIRLTYQQLLLKKGVPFSINIPNKETVKALKQVKSRKGLKSYANAKELFDQFR